MTRNEILAGLNNLSQETRCRKLKDLLENIKDNLTMTANHGLDLSILDTDTINLQALASKYDDNEFELIKKRAIHYASKIA
jgi:hypothetical protein